MPTRLVWDDAVLGAGTVLASAAPGVGGRFMNWVVAPAPPVVGAKHYGLGTGRRHVYAFRTEQRARFELRGIPRASMEQMLRLAAHLDGGGTVTVETGDGANRTYPACGLAEGAQVPAPQLADAKLLEYAMAFDLVNLDPVAPVPPLLCLY